MVELFDGYGFNFLPAGFCSQFTHPATQPSNNVTIKQSNLA